MLTTATRLHFNTISFWINIILEFEKMSLAKDYAKKLSVPPPLNLWSNFQYPTILVVWSAPKEAIKEIKWFMRLTAGRENKNGR